MAYIGIEIRTRYISGMLRLGDAQMVDWEGIEKAKEKERQDRAEEREYKAETAALRARVLERFAASLYEAIKAEVDRRNSTASPRQQVVYSPIRGQGFHVACGGATL